jgi:hypothetical protein
MTTKLSARALVSAAETSVETRHRFVSPVLQIAAVDGVIDGDRAQAIVVGVVS